MNKFIVLFSFLALFLIQPAYAAKGGFFVEPYYSHMVSGSSTQKTSIALGAPINTTIDASDDYDVSGSMYGLRTGMLFSQFIVGLEYSMGSLDLDDPDDSTDNDDDPPTFTAPGLLLGFAFSDRFDISLTYYLNWSAKTDDGFAGAKQTISGMAYRLGLGFKIVDYLKLGIDYYYFAMDDIDPNSGSANLPPVVDFTIDKFENKGSTILATLSFPLSF